MDKREQMEVIYTMERYDPHTGITAVWFNVKVTGFECTEVLLSLDKRTKNMLSGSKSFFKFSREQQNEAIDKARVLLN